ncbi:MAG: hypothetical protein HY619_07435 [Thaumarchaeota archaeon]|nr:hypothetical protein [Nitrososphaerota archaeon]
MSNDPEVQVINRFISMIEDIKTGLDPDVLASWYAVIESDAKSKCPSNLVSTIMVRQDPVLPMKFEFKASKRAVPFVVEAIENHLNEMPFATRLYFQKLEEVISHELTGSKPSTDAEPNVISP